MVYTVSVNDKPKVKSTQETNIVTRVNAYRIGPNALAVTVTDYGNYSNT
jgi:hypothetical protein